jgi:hypothetical protein
MGGSLDPDPSSPLLSPAVKGDWLQLRAALDAEVRAEQEKDRLYWEPLKREMEAFRRAEREMGQPFD